MSDEITATDDGFGAVKQLMEKAIGKMIMLTSGSETKPLDITAFNKYFEANKQKHEVTLDIMGPHPDMFKYCSGEDPEHYEVIKLVEEFIDNMEKSDFLERRNSVINRTITFVQQRIEAKETYWYTLRDIVGKFIAVKRYNPIDGNPANPSNHCKARHVFITILWIIKKIYYTQEGVVLNFKYTQGFTDSSLLKSSRVCHGITNSNDLRSSDSPLCPDNCKKNSDKVYVVNGGGSKSRRIRRRKHNRKTHRKHARKTHHKRGGRRTHSYAKRKRASKSHKRRK